MATAPRAAMAARSAPPWRERTGAPKEEGGRERGGRRRGERRRSNSAREGGSQAGAGVGGEGRRRRPSRVRLAMGGEYKREKKENEMLGGDG